MKHTPENRAYIKTALAGVHSERVCSGKVCVIHNPSGHKMHEWPLYYRADRGMMERICKHGVGHPDPDCPVARDDMSHGCCGCCSGASDPVPEIYWPPFGTIRACRFCGTLVSGGPTACGYCAAIKA